MEFPSGLAGTSRQYCANYISSRSHLFLLAPYFFRYRYSDSTDSFAAGAGNWQRRRPWVLRAFLTYCCCSSSIFLPCALLSRTGPSQHHVYVLSLSWRDTLETVFSGTNWVIRRITRERLQWGASGFGGNVDSKKSEPAGWRARFATFVLLPRGRRRSLPAGPWGRGSLRTQPLARRSTTCTPPTESRRSGRRRPHRTGAG